jgi:hypothetical protein
MEETPIELAIEEREDGAFVLSKKDSVGTTHELLLSELDVMFLARLAPSIAREISANKAPAGSDISVLLAVPVINFRIGSDLHQQIVILRLSDNTDAAFDFSFDPASARNVGTSLIAWADQIGNAPRPVQQ